MEVSFRCFVFIKYPFVQGVLEHAIRLKKTSELSNALTGISARFLQPWFLVLLFTVSTTWKWNIAIYLSFGCKHWIIFLSACHIDFFPLAASEQLIFSSLCTGLHIWFCIWPAASSSICSRKIENWRGKMHLVLCLRQLPSIV